MKIENCSLSSFTDTGKNGIQIGLKGYTKLDNDVNMVLQLTSDPQIHAWQVRLIREKQLCSYSRKVLEKTVLNGNYENTNFFNFFKSPAERLEKFFESLQGFPFKK